MRHWRGQYTFDEHFEPQFPNGLKTVDFEFTFRTRLFGFIIGEIRDGIEDIPEPAVVRGRLVAEKSIWFSKTYPRTWAPNPETGAMYIFDSRKHVVYYTGGFENSTTIYGTWEICAQHRVINGAEYELPRITGKWNAREV